MAPRPILAGGFLFVAPINLDFSQQAHSSKRWQRRYFTLYEDGELSYALDANPETLPQLRMHMSRCIRVCEADAITNHAHSILIAFKNDNDGALESTNGNRDDPPSGCDGHPVICYVKADTTDEIRWWKDHLQVFAEKNAQYISIQPSGISEDKAEWLKQEEACDEEEICLDADPPHSHQTIIQLDDSHDASSPCSATDLESLSFVEDGVGDAPLASESVPYTSDILNSHTVLPGVGVDTMSSTTPPVTAEKYEEREHQPISSAPPSDIADVPQSLHFQIDTSNLHTVRKGWLLLRGKTGSEWSKNWVVLAGLSLKMFKDVWAEDSTKPVLSIDLAECENVYPSSSARNYGIEIKCRKARYVLSAMTPGIRDSWIQALLSNLHNPSPTYPEPTLPFDAQSIAGTTDSITQYRKKKHIAYVAPGSHHSNSLMEDNVSTAEHSDGSLLEPGQVGEIVSLATPEPQTASLTSETSSGWTEPTNSIPPGVGARRGGHMSGHINARRQSLSPSMRRSPVNRLKERSADRQRYRAMRIVGEEGGATSSDSSSACIAFTPTDVINDDNGSTLSLALSAQPRCCNIRALRDQLHEAQHRMNGARGRDHSSMADSVAISSGSSLNEYEISQLRLNLRAVETHVIRQQKIVEDMGPHFGGNADFDNTKLPSEMSDRLVSLLKIQVGALSKILQCSNPALIVECNADQSLHKCIRIVANLDEGISYSLSKLELAFAEVIAAYKKLNSLLASGPIGEQLGDMPSENGKELLKLEPRHTISNLLEEIRDREKRMKRMESRHTSAIERQRVNYESQLGRLKERLAVEEEARKRLEEELHGGSHNPTRDLQLAHLCNSYEEQIAGLREEFKRLERGHRLELEEEKNATRLALDAVHRVHKEELNSLSIRLGSTPRWSELRASSALGTCNHESNRFPIELDTQHRQAKTEGEDNRLHMELQAKEETIEELRHRIAYLEAKLGVNGQKMNNGNHHQSNTPAELQAYPSSRDCDDGRKVNLLPSKEQSLSDQFVMAKASTVVRFRIPPATEESRGVGGPSSTAYNHRARTEKCSSSSSAFPIYNGAAFERATVDAYDGPTAGCPLTTKGDSLIAHLTTSHKPTGRKSNRVAAGFLPSLSRRSALALPVSERRKFFERVAEYNTTF